MANNLWDEYNRELDRLKFALEMVMWDALLDSKNKFCSIPEMFPGKSYDFCDKMRLCTIAKQITLENREIFEANMIGTAFRVYEKHPTSIAMSILLGKEWT